MSDNEAEDFIQEFEKAALSIKNGTERSKKYRAGVAALAQRAVDSEDMNYLKAAIRFTDHIVDRKNRSRAFVDIIRSISKVAQNTASMDLVQRSLELSDNTLEGLDRSHALEITVGALAHVGMLIDDPAVIDESVKLADTIFFTIFKFPFCFNLTVLIILIFQFIRFPQTSQNYR